MSDTEYWAACAFFATVVTIILSHVLDAIENFNHEGKGE